MNILTELTHRYSELRHSIFICCMNLHIPIERMTRPTPDAMKGTRGHSGIDFLVTAQDFYFCANRGDYKAQVFGSEVKVPFDEARGVTEENVPFDSKSQDQRPFDCKSQKSNSNSRTASNNEKPGRPMASIISCWGCDQKQDQSLTPNQMICNANYPSKATPLEESTAPTCTTSASSLSTIKSSLSSNPGKRFQSILDQPLRFMGELNLVLHKNFPSWSPNQRSRIIRHLVHFLELKVFLEQYSSTMLLMPTPIVDDAWEAIVLETALYEELTQSIQDFHEKPHAVIHYTRMQRRNLPSSKVESKIRRTQSLFQVYFNEAMPVTIDEEKVRKTPPRVVKARVPPSAEETESSESPSPSPTNCKETTYNPSIFGCFESVRFPSCAELGEQSLVDSAEETGSYVLNLLNL